MDFSSYIRAVLAWEKLYRRLNMLGQAPLLQLPEDTTDEIAFYASHFVEVRRFVGACEVALLDRKENPA